MLLNTTNCCAFPATPVSTLNCTTTCCTILNIYAIDCSKIASQTAGGTVGSIITTCANIAITSFVSTPGVGLFRKVPFAKKPNQSPKINFSEALNTETNCIETTFSLTNIFFDNTNANFTCYLQSAPRNAALLIETDHPTHPYVIINEDNNASFLIESGNFCTSKLKMEATSTKPRFTYFSLGTNALTLAFINANAA